MRLLPLLALALLLASVPAIAAPGGVVELPATPLAVEADAQTEDPAVFVGVCEALFDMCFVVSAAGS